MPKRLNCFALANAIWSASSVLSCLISPRLTTAWLNNSKRCTSWRLSRQIEPCGRCPPSGTPEQKGRPCCAGTEAAPFGASAVCGPQRVCPNSYNLTEWAQFWNAGLLMFEKERPPSLGGEAARSRRFGAIGIAPHRWCQPRVKQNLKSTTGLLVLVSNVTVVVVACRT